MAHANSWRETLHLDAGDGFGGGFGGGNGQTPGGAEVIDDPAAGYAGADPGGGQPGGDDPWSGEVPESMREEFGGQTWAEVREQFNRSRESASLVEAQKELIETLIGQARGAAPAAAPMQPQAPAAAPATPASFDWYGFGSRDRYQAAMAANPEGTLALIRDRQRDEIKREILEAMRGQPGAQPGAAKDPEVERMKASYRQQAAQTRMDRLAQTYEGARDPKIWNRGGPLDKFIGQNPWIHEVHDVYPDVDVHAIAFKLWDYDRLMRANTAQGVRMGETRAAAGVARPGVGARNVQPQAPKSHYEAALTALNAFRAKYPDKVTPAMERYVEGLRQGPGSGVQPRSPNFVG